MSKKYVDESDTTDTIIPHTASEVMSKDQGKKLKTLAK